MAKKMLRYLIATDFDRSKPPKLTFQNQATFLNVHRRETALFQKT